jgi:hypothetical protein
MRRRIVDGERGEEEPRVKAITRVNFVPDGKTNSRIIFQKNLIDLTFDRAVAVFSRLNRESDE